MGGDPRVRLRTRGVSTTGSVAVIMLVPAIFVAPLGSVVGDKMRRLAENRDTTSEAPPESSQNRNNSG